MAPKPVIRSSDDYTTNSLDIARDTFTWLVTGPHPVSLDGRDFEGLPNRQLPLDEVRDHLLARSSAQSTKDAVWTHLVLRSRAEGATWTVAAVGVALPALTSVAATLSARFAGDPADVHAEVLRGFLAALATIDLRPPRIMLRLRWAAYRSGYDALAEALASPIPIAQGFRSAPPHAPWGHPDLVLARAVRDGVITQTEAALIGATRLEEVSVRDWAAAHEVSEWAVYKARKRAEVRLVAYLRDDGTETEADEKSAARVSKPDAKSGVQGCGTDPRSAPSSEVPRCA